MPGKRIFVIEGRSHDDPNPAWTVEQVRDFYADFFAELHNSSTNHVNQGENDVYTFERRTGTKGELTEEQKGQLPRQADGQKCKLGYCATKNEHFVPDDEGCRKIFNACPCCGAPWDKKPTEEYIKKHEQRRG